MPNDLPPIPRLLRLTVNIISIVVLGSALLLAALAVGAPMLATGQRPSWALFGFEVVVSVAAVLGVLVGRGRFADGPGLALACVAGTVLVASGLGWQGAGRELLGVSLLPVLGGRTIAALTIGGIGAWCVLSRSPGSIRLALIGSLLVLPVVVGVGATQHPTGQRLVEKAMGTGPGTQFLAAVGVFTIVTILLSAGAHLLIRAFEMGRPDSASGRA